MASDMIQTLVDPLGSDNLRRNRYWYRQVHEFVGKLLDALVQCRTEEKVLTTIIGGKPAQNKPKIRNKSHIEHPVSLVDYQDFNTF